MALLLPGWERICLFLRWVWLFSWPTWFPWLPLTVAQLREGDVPIQVGSEDLVSRASKTTAMFLPRLHHSPRRHWPPWPTTGAFTALQSLTVTSVCGRVVSWEILLIGKLVGCLSFQEKCSLAQSNLKMLFDLIFLNWDYVFYVCRRIQKWEGVWCYWHYYLYC